MNIHATVGRQAAARVAGQVRAELARSGKTIGDLAECIGVTPHTAGRRLQGKTDFTAVEILQISAWLGVDIQTLMPPAIEMKATG